MLYLYSIQFNPLLCINCFYLIDFKKIGRYTHVCDFFCKNGFLINTFDQRGNNLKFILRFLFIIFISELYYILFCCIYLYSFKILIYFQFYLFVLRTWYIRRTPCSLTINWSKFKWYLYLYLYSFIFLIIYYYYLVFYKKVLYESVL